MVEKVRGSGPPIEVTGEWKYKTTKWTKRIEKTA